ncbi:MAG: phytanoyl-CoA dioxygenase family protein [Planctomycetota bacterium]|nr:MAG: phytanoyl-CoA dioxygenase family protein [Planctomycetota bacterium]REJ97580.1 MAG: phytanoyl-CoA dioxygenase family protein [Planctomycetota bacterium]REK23002.1 MAG: phytanoyl-CoA dioxygenase family protein [Planctomycetota bacterium]REK43365.1 MAG: phytanoyl-CoA dioxygenase family protein [Planctomycetota bacterium]
MAFAAGATNPLRDDDVARYEADGYLLLRKLFDEEETQLLQQIARADRRLQENVSDRVDASGQSMKLRVVGELSDDDIFSAIVRSRRVADTAERLLGEEVYHWHYKVIQKDAREGGAWEWHQDYGYWYNDACLKPTLLSCSIAIDRATRENGCLQVLRGSHHCGRVDHQQTGKQTGADPRRVAVMQEHFPLEYVELEPGDALFFHGNLMHRSDANRSEQPRWSLICCYNTRSNSPFTESRHPFYTPLERWADERVAELGRAQLAALRE